MLGLIPERASNQPVRILCLGAHSDDLEIGCSGTILHFISRFKKTEVYWTVLSSTPARATEAARSARSLLKGVRSSIDVQSFRDGFFPYHGAQLKEYFEQLKRKFVPDLIFTHYGDDAHQDHRVVSELTWNTFRNHCILEYEIPKYDGDLGRPNVFVPLSPAVCRRKLRTLMRFFATQRNKHWFTEDLFLGLMRLRGMEANSRTGFAEAFYGRKIRLS